MRKEGYKSDGNVRTAEEDNRASVELSKQRRFLSDGFCVAIGVLKNQFGTRIRRRSRYDGVIRLLRGRGRFGLRGPGKNFSSSNSNRQS